jgi:steroid delta-isomerase
MLERHVGKYNEAVRTSDFSPFLALYAEDAVMSFDGVPIGPLYGRRAIEESYAQRPPDDTMWLIDMSEVGDDAVNASFEWDAGGTGEMYLRWKDGLIVEQRIVPLNIVDLDEKERP